jgi:hypothetical protein
MENALKKYLKDNESLIDAIIETETGLIVRFPPRLLEKNPEAALRIISEVERTFKGGWLGIAENSLFIPSLATRLKRNLAECVEITAELNSINKIVQIPREKTEEERAFSHIEKPVNVEPQNDSVEEAFLKLRNYFVPKLSASEIESIIAFLMEQGFTRIKIAEKVGAAQSTIYKFSTVKKTDPIEKKNNLTG